MTTPYVPPQGQPPGQGGQQQPQQNGSGGWVQLPVPDPNARPGQPQPNPVPQPQQQLPSEPRAQFPQPYFPPPQQQQPTPQQQPQPQGQFPVPQVQQPAPQQQPQQQPVQQPQQQITPLVYQDAQGRLFGQGVPAHLQGLTMQQVQQLQRPSPVAPPQQQPQQPQFPQQQPQAQGQQPQAQRSFWQDPEGAIERIVDRKMQPMTQASQATLIQQARENVAAKYPNFREYENEVLQQLQGLDETVLANPAAWEYAFERAVGARALRGAQGGFQQVPTPQPVVPASAFFTESPSAGVVGSGPVVNDGSFGLSPAEQDMARRMGLSFQDYARGKGLQV